MVNKVAFVSSKVLRGDLPPVYRRMEQSIYFSHTVGVTWIRKIDIFE